MGLIKIESETPEDLFKPMEFPVLPQGKHLFIVANKLEITVVEESGNDLIKLEARCQDEDDNKGTVVFDNFIIVKDPQTDKHRKGQKMHQAKFAQFVAACGVATPEEIAAGVEFDLDDFEGKVFQAVSRVSMEPVYPAELDENGNPVKARRASIKQYLHDVS